MHSIYVQECGGRSGRHERYPLPSDPRKLDNEARLRHGGSDLAHLSGNVASSHRIIRYCLGRMSLARAFWLVVWVHYTRTRRLLIRGLISEREVAHGPWRAIPAGSMGPLSRVSSVL